MEEPRRRDAAIAAGPRGFERSAASSPDSTLGVWHWPGLIALPTSAKKEVLGGHAMEFYWRVGLKYEMCRSRKTWRGTTSPK